MTNDSRKSEAPVAISFLDYRDGEIVDFFANEHRTFRPETGEEAQKGFGHNRVVGRPHFSATEKAAGKADVNFRPSSEPSGQKSPKAGSRPPAVAAGILRSDESSGTIPLPAEFLDDNLEVAAATLGGGERRKRRPGNREPSFGKQARSLGSLAGLSNLPEEHKAGRVLIDPLAGKTVRPRMPEKQTEDFAELSIVALAEVPVREEAAEVALPKETISLEDSLLARCRELDEQLGRLVQNWPRLPEQLRETISALIDVAEKGDTP